MAFAGISRKIVGELNSLIGRKIAVRLTNGKTYTGTLEAFDHPDMNLILNNVVDERGDKYVKVIVKGSVISEILIKELPLFDPYEFAQILERELGLRRDAIKVYPEAGVVMIFNSIKVSEHGVEGQGPMANKVYSIYTKYIEERRKKLSTEIA